MPETDGKGAKRLAVVIAGVYFLTRSTPVTPPEPEPIPPVIVPVTQPETKKAGLTIADILDADERTKSVMGAVYSYDITPSRPGVIDTLPEKLTDTASIVERLQKTLRGMRIGIAASKRIFCVDVPRDKITKTRWNTIKGNILRDG